MVVVSIVILSLHTELSDLWKKTATVSILRWLKKSMLPLSIGQGHSLINLQNVYVKCYEDLPP